MWCPLTITCVHATKEHCCCCSILVFCIIKDGGNHLVESVAPTTSVLWNWKPWKVLLDCPEAFLLTFAPAKIYHSVGYVVVHVAAKLVWFMTVGALAQFAALHYDCPSWVYPGLDNCNEGEIFAFSASLELFVKVILVKSCVPTLEWNRHMPVKHVIVWEVARCKSLGESSGATLGKLVVPTPMETCRRGSLNPLLLKPVVKLKFCREVKLEKARVLLSFRAGKMSRNWLSCIPKDVSEHR